jgi:hypothetical protein
MVVDPGHTKSQFMHIGLAGDGPAPAGQKL